MISYKAAGNCQKEQSFLIAAGYTVCYLNFIIIIQKKKSVRLFAKDITVHVIDRQVVINWRAGQLVLDEPIFNGGKRCRLRSVTAVYPV